MEKIQQAIAKAREMREAQQREEGAGAAPPQPAKATPPAVPPDPAPAEMPGRDRVWTAIPEISVPARRLRRNRILTGEGGKQSADFDMIRTRILQAQKANGWRRIAITSPEPGSGKSTLALNLAFSLARQPEQHTILAEVDLRRPSLAKTLGLKQGYDFAAVLGGRETFEDNCCRIGPNLILTTNSGPARNPSELLQSQQASDVLDAIDTKFRPTIMLFDLPPMLAGDDAMAFLPKVDATILVAAAEKTTLKQIDLCERDIASQTNVLGIVLNKCRYMDRDRSYGYDYY
jgi:capsular exopolysaccharide synthesis family protein